jgi:hypothetical protein
MTRQEFVHAETLNLFGSDIQPPEFEAMLSGPHPQRSMVTTATLEEGFPGQRSAA